MCRMCGIAGFTGGRDDASSRCIAEALAAEHETGRRNREKELWSLLALEVFLRTLRRPDHAYHAAA